MRVNGLEGGSGEGSHRDLAHYLVFGQAAGVRDPRIGVVSRVSALPQDAREVGGEVVGGILPRVLGPEVSSNAAKTRVVVIVEGRP